MGFFGRALFGKKKLNLQQTAELMSQPDSDGVTRVFSRELWDDPEIGGFLQEMGYNPDDACNQVRTAEDWITIFKQSEQDLIARTVAFSKEMEAKHGYCRAIPKLVIDKPIYNGEHGAFLYAQMDLIGFHDWNVIMCAMDERTKKTCDLPLFPGDLPGLNTAIEERVIGWKQRHDFLLETFGLSATGQKGGISGEEYQAAKDDLRSEILETIAATKPLLVEQWRRNQSSKSS